MLLVVDTEFAGRVAAVVCTPAVVTAAREAFPMDLVAVQVDHLEVDKTWMFPFYCTQE